jgi:ribosomal protein L29
MKKEEHFPSLSNEELLNKLKETREALFKIRLEVLAARNKHIHLIRKYRRDIARILTELNRRLREKLKEKSNG